MALGTLGTTLAVASVAGTGASIYGGVQQQKAAKKGRQLSRDANQQAENAARKNMETAEQNINRANQKQPDIAAILASAQAPKVPSTILSGASGIQTSTLLGM